MQDLESIHLQVTVLVREVGRLLMTSYAAIPIQKSKSFAYSQKVRMKAEKIIIAYIKKHHPSSSIILDMQDTIKKEGPRTWHVHALDGAVNFATRTPAFGVSIAITEATEVVYGIIHLPLIDETFHAIKNKGAFINGKKIRVSINKSISYSIGTTTPAVSKKLSEPLQKLAALAKTTKHFRISSLGCGAYHGTYVACGRRDFWLSTDGPLYDVCVPASLIIREAGGRVTTFEGNEWKLGNLTLLGSNGKIHNKILKSIK
jgi:myo-inositol-1(or 4)-monophosphatase